MKRRTVLKRFIALVGGVTGLYAWQIEPFWLEFVRVKMTTFLDAPMPMLCCP